MQIKKYFTTALYLMVFCSLVACEVEEDPENGGTSNGDTNTPANNTLQLSTIGDKSVITNQALKFRLFVSNAGAAQLVFSATGTVGIGSLENPFVQVNPATFNQATGEFEWTPTDAEIGKYSVQFSVKENVINALTSNIVVNITVDTLTNIGQQVYTANCSSCHGVDGTGIVASDIRLKTTLDISTALTSVKSMQSIASKLDLSQIDAMASYLLVPQLNGNNHNARDLTNGCVRCHDGNDADAPGKSATHITASNTCQACHNIGGSFSPVISVDHGQVTGACADCHNGTIAPAKKAGHISSSNECGACHKTSSFKDVATVNHSAITGGCVECHNGTIAIGKKANHITTSGSCGSCHGTAAFNLNRSVAHANQFSGVCADCHNGGISRAASHGDRVFDCGECHAPTSFKD